MWEVLLQTLKLLCDQFEVKNLVLRARCEVVCDEDVRNKSWNAGVKRNR